MAGIGERNTRMLDNYMNVPEAAFEEHATDAGRRADMRARTETERLGHETNKRLSTGQLNLKRGANREQEELKDRLFVELRDKPANFMEIQDYQRLLDRQAKATKELVGDEELITYMDPSDADKLQRIATHHNTTIRVSEYSLNGGTRAVLPGKHILIDNSFQTRLGEARHEFRFDLTGGRQSG